MPSVIKRNTSHVEDTGFEVYTGDEPPRGGYRAVVKKVDLQMSKGGNLMYAIVVELKAKPGSDKSKYDGAPFFPYIVMTDNDVNIGREQALYVAIAGKKDVDVTAATSIDKLKPNDKQKITITKIGGVSPVGKVVNVQVKSELQEDGTKRSVVDRIFRVRDEDAEEANSTSEYDEEELDGGDEELALYEEDDLRGKSLVALRKILVEEFEFDKADAAALKTKDKLVDAILEAQDEEAPEDDEEADESDDEEDDEEDDEDREAEIREEVEGMTRVQVKAALKKYKVHADRTFKKTESDDALAEELVQMRLQDPPF